MVVSEPQTHFCRPSSLARDRASCAGGTRSLRPASLTRDYIGLIADLLESTGEARTVDIARRRGVTHPTAIKAIRRLKRDGLVTGRPYRGLFLTAAGRSLAEEVRARRHIVARLLMAVGVPPPVAEMDAAAIEHHLSRCTLDTFLRFLSDGYE